MSSLYRESTDSLILGLVIGWYKARERDEIARSQTLVKDIYYKYQQKTGNKELASYTNSCFLKFICVLINYRPK